MSAQSVPMTEKQLQDAVIALARAMGYRTYHTYDSRKSDAGFPDLVLVRGERLLFAELKAEGRQPTEFQARWLDALRQTQAQVFVWRPSDWRDGSVEAVLRYPWAAA